MNNLIFGGLGFIGSHLTKEIKGDISDIKNQTPFYYCEDLSKYDTIINLAAYAGVRQSEEQKTAYFNNNVTEFWKLIQIIEKENPNVHFIHFSSSSVYGNNSKKRIKETAPKKPKSTYGMTKVISELIVRRLKNHCIVRPFTVVGENGRPQMVIYKWLNEYKEGKPVTFYGDGKTSRGYTHVSDIVEAVKMIIDKKVKGVYNIGGQEAITLEELWTIFKEVFPNAKRNKLKMPEYDQSHNLADTSKALKTFGWYPKKSSKEEIKKIYNKYKINK